MPRTHIAIIGAPLDLGQDRRGVDMGPSAVRVANLQCPRGLARLSRSKTGAISRSNRRKPGRKAIRTPSTSPQIAAACEALANRVVRSPARRPPAAGPGRRSFRRRRHGQRRFPPLSRTRREGRPDLAGRARRHEHARDQPERQRPRHAAGLHSGHRPDGTGRPAAATARRSIRATRSSSDCATWTPLEKPQVRDSGVRAFTMRDIDERGLRAVMEEAIRIATDGTAGFHLSLDMDFCDPVDAPGVGTPVRGGATYREAHLAMEMICDSRRMISMEVVEVNPVIDETQPHRRFRRRTDHVRIGKTNSMKIRVAVIYGGRTGEHEVSVRSAKSILAGLDPREVRDSRVLHRPGGQVEPAARFCPNRARIPTSTWSSRCCTAPSARTAPCRDCWNWPTCPTSARACWRRAVSMDKEMMKRVCKERMLPIVEYVTRHARVRRTSLEACRAPAVSDVRQARQSRLVASGISKAHDDAELEAAFALAAQYDRKVIVERGIEGRELECSVLGNEAPDGFPALRDSALPRVLRLRRQVSAGSWRRPRCPPTCRPERTDGIAPPGRGMLSRGGVRRHGARGFLPGDGDRTGSTSTRSIPSPASLRSACIPKMWEHSGIAFGDLLDRLIALALDRDKLKKATRFTR